MAEIILTREQQAVVENRGGTLLVSAAAGSGKTKVLIDRILRRVETEQMNVDDFLMITFSTAAASELRGKLIAQLSMELARRPDDRHLQKQMSRVYLAQISTVHSFCSSLLREYAYLLELPPDFRVCDEQEAILLRERAMQVVLEQAYSHLKETPDVADTLNMLAAGRNDRVLPELIWSVYLSVQCCRDPQQRCEELKKCLDVTACTDAGETIWGRYLIDEMHHFLDGCIKTMDDCLATAQQSEALAKYVSTLQDNVRLLRSLRAMERWEELQTAAPDFGRLSAITKCTDPEAQERVKAARTRVVKKVRELLSRFSVPSGEVLEDLKTSSGALRGLFHLTEEFSEAFQSEKRRRRMLDYNDLEHEALRLLVRRDGSKTNAAREISQRYAEAAPGECLDVNVQLAGRFSADHVDIRRAQEVIQGRQRLRGKVCDNLQIPIRVACYHTGGNGRSDALSPTGVGNHHTLDVFQNVAADGGRHPLRQLPQELFHGGGAVGDGDGLGAARGRDQFLAQNGDIVAHDILFQHCLSILSFSAGKTK